jgi:hypothetical protein
MERAEAFHATWEEKGAQPATFTVTLSTATSQSVAVA